MYKHIHLLPDVLVLCGAGVPTITFPMYHAFSRHVGRLSRQEISTESLQEAVASAATKWEMRGLLRPVLAAIAADVYNIPVPAPASSSVVISR